MKLPKIDVNDSAWAEADWPKLPWLDKLKVNTRRSAVTFIKGTAKKIATSQKLREKIIDFGKFQKIEDDTYRISTDFVFQSYLFVGKKKALLIDTGLGIGNLIGEVRKVTDKPLEVICTHPHFGVVGGAGQFDEVKIEKSDLRSAKVYNKIVVYLMSLKKPGAAPKYGNFVPLTKHEIEHGIDIGGRTIKIVHVPSHTKGSCCFIDESKKVVVIGDIATPLGFELLPFVVPLNTYYDNLDNLLSSLDNKKIYCSYFPKALDKEYVADFKTTLYQASIVDNDYKKPIKAKKGNSKKLLILYYGAKGRRRAKDTRWAAIKSSAKELIS